MNRVLILIALCASMAIGQTQKELAAEFDKQQSLTPFHSHTIVFGVADGSVYRWIFSGDTVYTKYAATLPSVLVPQAMLDLYTAYERECYNDSTLSRFHIIHRQP